MLPGARTTNAFGTSSPRSSYTPITAASATSGRGEQHRLELGRRHLVALVLDQLLDPVDDEPPAVLVDHADVAGVQPAVGVDEGVGLLLPAEVALHPLRAADPDLALLARADVLAGRDVDQPRLGATGTSLPTVPGGAARPPAVGTRWVPGESSVIP